MVSEPKQEVQAQHVHTELKGNGEVFHFQLCDYVYLVHLSFCIKIKQLITNKDADFQFLTPQLWFVLKDKEVPLVQDEEDDQEITQKRHLNAVFIGHVGKWMNS